MASERQGSPSEHEGPAVDETAETSESTAAPVGPAASEAAHDSDGAEPGDVVEHPAKVIRIGSMSRELLEELRQAPLDDASRGRLREMYELSIAELSEGLSQNLREELVKVTVPFRPDQTPSEAELRVAQAQLVGWLEGLFHGIQATLFAQQIAARAQLEQLHQQGRATQGEDQPVPGIYM